MTNLEQTRNELQEFIGFCIDEEKQVKAVLKTNTMDGNLKAIAIWENHFEQKYIHGIDVVKDIARVNVLRQMKNQNPLVETSNIERIAMYDNYEIYFVGNNGYFYNGKVNSLKESKAEIETVLQGFDTPYTAIKRFIEYFRETYN